MGKYIVSFIVGTGSVFFCTYADSLTELKGLENVGSGSSENSPSQVVILNHTPSQSQDQKTKSLNSSNQRYKARSGWGNGESLEALRESRIDKEAENEQVLMERLETSRIEDEKSRLRRLFKVRQYNKRRYEEINKDYDSEFDFSESDYESETSYSPVKRTEKAITVINAPVTEAKRVAAIAPDASALYNVSKARLSNAYSLRPYYLKGQLGMGKYSAARNARTPIGDASWGFSVGKHIDDRWTIEAGLYKTSYEIDDPGAYSVETYDFNNRYLYSQARSLKQYNFSGLLGFKLINANRVLGSLRGGLSYVRRHSESSDIPGIQAFRSNTIDGLLGLGVDVEIDTNIMLTASFDYYSNLLNDIGSTNLQVVERVETANYYVAGVGLKFNF